MIRTVTKHQWEKAARLLASGGALVAHVGAGPIVSGIVRASEPGRMYRVTVDPDGHHCTCTWAGHHPLAPCSHTAALLLRAQQDGLITISDDGLLEVADQLELGEYSGQPEMTGRR